MKRRSAVRWMIVGLIAVATVVNYIDRNALAVMWPEISREIGADRTFLTHLTHDNFHADLEAELPRGVSPAFDGLTIRIDES